MELEQDQCLPLPTPIPALALKCSFPIAPCCDQGEVPAHGEDWGWLLLRSPGPGLASGLRAPGITSLGVKKRTTAQLLPQLIPQKN